MRLLVSCSTLFSKCLSLHSRAGVCECLETFPKVQAASYCCQPGSKHVSLSYASYESTQAEDQRSPIIILHGLFGSKNNWKSLSKAMINATKRKVYALDARNHGESPHTEEMDYILMANDVDLFCKERGLQKVAIIGHSMGGRSAMTFALTRPSMVERLVVVDVSPITMPSIVMHDNVLVNHINSMDTVLPQLSPDMSSPAARKEADRILANDIPEVAVRQFLLANLQKGERLYEWQFNLKALKQNLPNIIQMPDLKGLTYDGETLFVCGGDSPYVSKRDHGAIKEKFPKANIIYIKGGGHWVHADKPAEFLNLIKEFMGDGTS
ncbi:sn-1-specific diacylglycerol lipase ABHD11-like isoform X1 [Dermacentor albipictus]|uniref:sn-1-specific diacylglycerol lipase ABHD11-like isoform X1 n=2 Tax=Dermacentor albipictus TaxID=60249 RepID=UPI0038FCDD27